MPLKRQRALKKVLKSSLQFKCTRCHLFGLARDLSDFSLGLDVVPVWKAQNKPTEDPPAVSVSRGVLDGARSFPVCRRRLCMPLSQQLWSCRAVLISMQRFLYGN